MQTAILPKTQWGENPWLQLLQLTARPSPLLTLLLQSKSEQSCCLDCGIGTIGIRNRNRTPGTQIFQETRFGGEQSDARAGAARFCQVMLLERSILADASARRRVCGSRARDGAALLGKFGGRAVCGGARGSNLAARAGQKTHRGLPDMARRARQKKSFRRSLNNHVPVPLA